MPIDPLSVAARYWSCDGENTVGLPESPAAGTRQGMGQEALAVQDGRSVRQVAPDMRREEPKTGCHMAEPQFAHHAAEAIVRDPIRSPVPGVPSPGVSVPGIPGVAPADVPDRGLPGSVPAGVPAQPVTEPGVAPAPVTEPKTGAEIRGDIPQTETVKPAEVSAARFADVPSPVFLRRGDLRRKGGRTASARGQFAPFRNGRLPCQKDRIIAQRRHVFRLPGGYNVVAAFRSGQSDRAV